MYNHYLYDDHDPFDDLFVDVSHEKNVPEVEAATPAASSPISEIPDEKISEDSVKPTDAQPVHHIEKNPKSGLQQGLHSILSRFKQGDNSLISLLILAFLLLDADEDERLIIIALAFLLGL